MIFILCAIILLQAGILYRLWQQRRQAELLARNRLRYIEEWLDLLYLYNNAPVSFHTRCKELASVKQLSNYHIVDDSLRSSVRRRHCRSSLTPAEKEFLCLMESGFSNRALCVIFRVGKVGSIYVKHHRIRAKIANENKSAGGDWGICQIAFLSFSNKTDRVYPASTTDKSFVYHLFYSRIESVVVFLGILFCCKQSRDKIEFSMSAASRFSHNAIIVCS